MQESEREKQCRDGVLEQLGRVRERCEKGRRKMTQLGLERMRGFDGLVGLDNNRIIIIILKDNFSRDFLYQISNIEYPYINND